MGIKFLDMKKICVFWACFALYGVVCVASASDRMKASLETKLMEYTSEKDADIGVSVVWDLNEAGVNDNEFFAMLSVYKFPQALAVADYCIRNGISFEEKIVITPTDLKENTYSPLRDKMGVGYHAVPISELLAYTIQQSDNNACDILFRYIGGVDKVQSYMENIGISDIFIKSTEDELHADIRLCYENKVTPRAMSSLIKYFRERLEQTDARYRFIASLMEQCVTGNARLVKGIMDRDVKIGHKTGTGDVDSNGKIVAVNDVGYVVLPNGNEYIIAVFVNDSQLEMPETEQIIADISSLVYETLRIESE